MKQRTLITLAIAANVIALTTAWRVYHIEKPPIQKPSITRTPPFAVTIMATNQTSIMISNVGGLTPHHALPPGWTIVCDAVSGRYAPKDNAGHIFDMFPVGSRELAVDKAWRMFKEYNKPTPNWKECE